MKPFRTRFALALLVLSFFNATAATTRYVDLNNTNPVSPYTNWATAATNIQDAINAASFNDTILVTNGIYQYGAAVHPGQTQTNRVFVPFGLSLTIQSVNGPSVTTIAGYQVPGTTNGVNAVRCVYLTEFSSLSGFTLTNGATQTSGSGGGVTMESSCTVSNCIIEGNAAANDGGGVYSGNNSLVANCVVSGNTAGNSGGGTYECVLNNCMVSNNNATYGGGVGNCTVNDSLLTGNGNTNSIGGEGGASYLGALNNCTVVGNSSYGRGACDGSYLVNCIIYSNINNGYADCYQCRLTNCCTSSLVNNGIPVNTITNPPAFANPAGDFHLLPWSPCIDAGTNISATGATDLDGNPRIVGGTVDMGAYENQNTNPVHYVSLTSTNPVTPFTSWTTAATNIQDAIDASVAGDFIVVSNGTYNSGGRAVYGTATNRVTIDKAITVQSFSGAGVTAIVGFNIPPASTFHPGRCAYLTNGASLAGFTLAYGGVGTSGDAIREQSGGGVWCESVSATVSNCIISTNLAIKEYGGGAFGGTLLNCVLTNNTAPFGGGTASNILINCILTHNSSGQQNLDYGGGAYGSWLSNCLITANQALAGSGFGAGAAFSTLTACVVSNNSAGASGGGLYQSIANNSLISSNRALSSGGGAFGSTLNNCTVNTNSARYGGGVCFGVVTNSFILNNIAGTGGGACSNTLINCVLNNNTANYDGFIDGAQGGGAYKSALFNCTVVGNQAVSMPGGPAGGGVNDCAVTNCIVHYNSCLEAGSNFWNSTMNYCDTAPLPTNGFGNITNVPAFVNLAGEDFHLQTNSPCINSGNNNLVSSTTDFDGNPRISGGTVDIGAFEFQSPSSTISYAYLQQYGLLTDGSADNTDTDGDGMSNYAEWRAGTNPTDASSLLQMTSVAPTNNLSGATITWQSVSGVNYFVQRGSDLSAQPIFSTIQSNIVGQAGTTSFTDTNVAGNGPFFYRVGVQ